MTEQMQAMMNEDEFLEHFGVKGMKWGKRKAAPTHTSADAARYNKISGRAKKNGLDNLSNDDIAKLNKRNQLLTEYKKNNPNTIQKGNKAAKEALAVVGTITAVAAVGSTVVKSPLARAGAKAVLDFLKS
jgi:hypothetical protein